MSDTKKYDAIVIGSGQGGTPLCQALAKAGLRTALVEREHVGGTCVNEGCTPSKTMVASGRVAYLVRRAADYGVHVEASRVNMARVRERKRGIVNSFRDGSRRRIDSTPNLDFLAGEASFTGPKEVMVDSGSGGALTLGADHFFINAGCRPAVPDLEGLRQVPFLDSTSVMELDAVPQHLLVLGGGYVGLEFGQLFRRLGSEVTIVHSGEQLLAREDADVAQAVQEILQEDGIGIFMRAKTAHVRRQGSGVALALRLGEQTEVLEGSHLLVATGRVPNSDLLNLSAAGIATDSHGYIVVNDRLETNVPGVYALGDIKGGPAFTHISYDDFRIIRSNFLEGGNASISGRIVPYTVFIDPQLGRVGLSEGEARNQGRRIRVAKMPMSYVARALEMDETRGFLKAVVDAESGEILGAAVLGVEGGEIAAQLQIAMIGRLPYTALRDAVFTHPNQAEALNNLFYSFIGE